MKRVAILTDFVSHDAAYSLCSVASTQAKMLHRAGYEYKVLTRGEIDGDGYPGARMVALDHGDVSNEVKVTGKTAGQIDRLTEQMRGALKDVDVVLTHDLIYQAAFWHGHVAARRVAAERADLHWLHWVHSATPSSVVNETGPFRKEYRGKFLNSRLVVFHAEETLRKRLAFGYERYETVTVPNPIDFTEGYHPAALEAIEKGGLWDADIIAVYPCRLDRGKQPHIIMEVFVELRGMGYDAKVVIVDFHSTAGDKATYRQEMKMMAESVGLPLLFTSNLDYKDAGYHLPHKAVTDLFAFGDILIHPSRSEGDPLIVPEAAWARCGLVLNFDLPAFRQWEDRAQMYKFSSGIDVLTGFAGSTNTEYSDRRGYMRDAVAAGIAYEMGNNSVLLNHARMRKERSLKAVWEKHLWPAIEGC